MIELPEAYILAKQINEVLIGKTVTESKAAASPHGFAAYTDDPAEYNSKLSGKTVESANPGTGYTCGGNVEIIVGDTLLVLSTPIKYHKPGDKLPAKHQLMLKFQDGSHITCTVQMWGGMFCYPIGTDGLPESHRVNKSLDPLTDDFILNEL